MSMDRRLWSHEVRPISFRKISKSLDWWVSTALRNGHSFLKNCVRKPSGKGQASSAERGTFESIKMVQSSQSRNQ